MNHVNHNIMISSKVRRGQIWLIVIHVYCYHVSGGTQHKNNKAPNEWESFWLIKTAYRVMFQIHAENFHCHSFSFTLALSPSHSFSGNELGVSTRFQYRFDL